MLICILANGHMLIAVDHVEMIQVVQQYYRAGVTANTVIYKANCLNSTALLEVLSVDFFAISILSPFLIQRISN